MMIARYLIVLLLLFPNSKALANSNYDPDGNFFYYPANSKLPPESFPLRNAAGGIGDSSIPVSTRLILWSEFKGVNHSRNSISPDRFVWKVDKVSCRTEPNGTRVHFTVIHDAQQGDQITWTEVKYSKIDKPKNCSRNIEAR